MGCRSLRAKVIISVVVLLFVSMVIFALLGIPEGDPAQRILGDAQWVKDLRGLHRDVEGRPFVVRYVLWLQRVWRYLLAGGPRRSGLEPLLTGRFP